jgi:peptidoglycan hydrolase-like protein with peptidoglycan-binding domain
MRRLLSIKLVAIALLSLALLAAGCSSDNSSDTTVGASATETTKASTGAAMSSALIEEVQTALAHLEYHTGPIDGIYGPSTVSGIEAFQTDAGIAVDGRYGPETHDALVKTTEEADFNWDHYAAIKELQTQMTDLGFYSGAIDGEYGPETVAGVKSVQAACGITQDGIYGPDTHSCLADLGGDA